MGTNSDSEAIARGLERHIQSGLMAILAALTGWMALTIQDSTVKLAGLTEKVMYLERQIGLDSSIHYTASDAAKDLRLRDEVLTNVTNRVLTLEQYHRGK